MPIPESQLQVWAKVDTPTAAAATGRAIRDALEGPTSLVRDRAKSIYLQGSYKNTTNIHADSDVDVVVQLRQTWGYDVSTLSLTQRAAFDRQLTPATYLLGQFRGEVETTLKRAFPNLVEPGNKAIRVLKRPGLLHADVVPCQTYRHYKGSPSETHLPKPVEGMQFYTVREKRQIVNWPRHHFDNGVAKHGRTGEYYKPTVRIFKNLRNRLYERGLPDTTAPSYFVECLLYNVPDNSFGRSYAMTVAQVLAWLYQEYQAGRFENFVCGNGATRLFGTSPEQWDVSRAWRFVAACCEAWNKW